MRASATAEPPAISVGGLNPNDDVGEVSSARMTKGAGGQATCTLRQPEPLPIGVAIDVSRPDRISRSASRKPGAPGEPVVSNRSRRKSAQEIGSLSKLPRAAAPPTAYESQPPTTSV